MRRLLVLLCVLSVPVAHARAGEGATVVEKGQARATVTAPPFDPSDPAASVDVTITSRGRTRTWKYDQLWLDPEETGVPAAQIFTVKDRDLLFVHAYTGGASGIAISAESSVIRPLLRALRSPGAARFARPATPPDALRPGRAPSTAYTRGADGPG